MRGILTEWRMLATFRSLDSFGELAAYCVTSLWDNREREEWDGKETMIVLETGIEPGKLVLQGLS